MQANATSLEHVTLLGSCLPRRCGIATFTSDLTTAILSEFPAMQCDVVAMNDHGAHHAYDERVRFEVADADPAAYRRAADFLNVGTTDVLSLQHEYGIFGGKAGSLVLDLLRELRMPIVTTLHTIVRAPSREQQRVMDRIVSLSTRLVVMSQMGADLLHEVHGVSSAPRARGPQVDDHPSHIGFEGRVGAYDGDGHVVLGRGVGQQTPPEPHVVPQSERAGYGLSAERAASLVSRALAEILARPSTSWAATPMLNAREPCRGSDRSS